MSALLTEERCDNLRRIANFVKDHVRRSKMASLDEVDLLARGVLDLLDERLTPAEAGAIQAVSETEALRRGMDAYRQTASEYVEAATLPLPDGGSEVLSPGEVLRNLVVAEKLRRENAALRIAGAGCSNACFNLAQNEALPAHVRASLRDGVDRWDRATREASHEPVFTAAQVREAVGAVADGRGREAEERGAREVLRNLGL